MAKDNVPVLVLELAEQRPSGFIMDGTRGTPFQHERTTPTISWIPTEGTMVDIDDKGVTRHRKIRHIKGCETIFPEEQQLKGYQPHRINDKIPFDQAFITIRREGGSIGTYDFLKSATYFEDNPNRPKSVMPLYREVKVDKEAEYLVDEEELVTRAKFLVFSLRETTGNKESKYRYDEETLSVYCRLLNIAQVSPEQDLFNLITIAKSNPKHFIQTIEKSSQTVVTEVAHALDLGVIRFEGNTAIYNEGDKVLQPLGSGNISQDKKIERLAKWLMSVEGTQELSDFRTYLEIAKEKTLK